MRFMFKTGKLSKFPIPSRMLIERLSTPLSGSLRYLKQLCSWNVDIEGLCVCIGISRGCKFTQQPFRNHQNANPTAGSETFLSRRHTFGTERRTFANRSVTDQYNRNHL